MLSLGHTLWLEVQSGLYDRAGDFGRRAPEERAFAYGHLTRGGIELRIDSTLPPVRRPNVVPRS